MCTINIIYPRYISLPCKANVVVKKGGIKIMAYDFIFRNGKQIDFSTGKIFYGDLYVKDGCIVDKNTEGDNESAKIEEIDVKGKYILPGLIDEHAHLNYGGSSIGSNTDLVCIPSGVTTAVDGGTTGWANFELFYRANQIRFTTNIKSFLHVSDFGVHDTSSYTEDMDPEHFREDKIISTIKKFPNTIVGLKIRMDRTTTDSVIPLKKAIEIANHIEQKGYHCVVDTHCANLPYSVTIADVLEILRPGDIFTHVFQNRGETIFDEKGKIKSCVHEARKRGILFDCCNGRIHWSFRNMRLAIEQNFLPDIISSDIIRESSYIRPGFSLIHAMTTLLASGMKECDIFKAVTYTPAKALNILNEAGTLCINRPADITIMDIADIPMALYDKFGESVVAKRIFLPLLTMKNGEIAYRQMFF